MMTPLALVYGELGAMFPESGGPGRFADHAFGSLAGATFGWFAYLQAATIAPIEVLAAIEYLSTNSWAAGSTTPAAARSADRLRRRRRSSWDSSSCSNLMGIRLLARTNSAITVFKLGIPALAAVALFAVSFHPGNVTAAGGFAVHGGERPRPGRVQRDHGRGDRLRADGIRGCAPGRRRERRPQRDLPRAVLGAFLICTLLYVAVQVAFIVALPPSLLAHHTSWTQLADDPLLARAPFFALAGLVGLAWLAWVMRVDAVVSPGGTGLLYMTGASPARLRPEPGRLRAEALPRRGRAKRRAALGRRPVRRPRPPLPPALPELEQAGERGDRGRGAHVRGGPAGARVAPPFPARGRSSLPPPGGSACWPPLSFVFATFIAYWSGWQTISTLMLALGVGYAFMGAARSLHLDLAPPPIEWASAWWLAPYLVGLATSRTSATSGRRRPRRRRTLRHVLVGGEGRIPLGWDLLCLTVLALAVYAGAVRQGGRATPGVTAGTARRDRFPSPRFATILRAAL